MSQRRTKERPVRHGQEQSDGSVRRSTLVVSVIASLLVGLYMGTLIPSFMGAKPLVQGTSTQAQSEQAEMSSHIVSARAAVEKDPQDAQAWVHLGNLYYDSHQAAEAVKAYTKALEIMPNNANVLTDRGTMYRELGKYGLALESFQKASQINPNHEQSLFNAGVVLYFDLSRKAEGIESWQKLLRVNPSAKAPSGQSLQDMLRELQ